jgi:hypothetical protein
MGLWRSLSVGGAQEKHVALAVYKPEYRVKLASCVWPTNRGEARCGPRGLLVFEPVQDRMAGRTASDCESRYQLRFEPGTLLHLVRLSPAGTIDLSIASSLHFLGV